MKCPECFEEDEQYFHRRYPGDREQPEEPAHWECGYCGHCYDEDPGAEIDAAFDSMTVDV